MTAYAPSDVRAINVSGGCGTAHVAADDLPEGDKFSIDCPPCELILVNTPSLGWAGRSDAVALTCDERFAYETAAQRAAHKQATTWSDPNALADALRQAMVPAGAPAPSLAEQIRAMSADDRAALRELLTDPEPAPKTAAPVKKTAAKKAAPAAGGE